jgi:uncharacterized protein GlcG (DUF336 family)
MRLANTLLRGMLATAIAATCQGLPTAAQSEEAIVVYKSLSPDAALEAAQAALKKCRTNGYQVAVVVADRFGQPMVLLRDRFAGPPAASTATDKAYTAVSFRSDTTAFAKAIKNGDLSEGLMKLPHVLAMGGGMVIEASGSLLGAIGVAGAPGGDKDEECAKAGLDAIRDKLDF